MKTLGMIITCVALTGGCAIASKLNCPQGQLNCDGGPSAKETDAAAARDESMGRDASMPVEHDAASQPDDAAVPIAHAEDAGDAQPPSMTREDDAGVSQHPTPPGPIDKVDLLFVVDNSNSMIAKQASLKAALPSFIEALTTGTRPTGEQSGYPALHDLHVGVVSTDMGTAGINFSSCHADGGDDGRLQHAPHGTNCQVSYPEFLSFDAATNQDSAQFAGDFACIAALGTGGCGFEQSLEAPLKALWPSMYLDSSGNAVTPNPISFLSTTPQGTLGHGDVPAAQGGNLGFLRNEASDPSLIAVVLLTDEDDCSARNTEIFAPNSQLPVDSPYRTQDVNLRCFDNPDKLYDVQLRYLTGLRKLRSDDHRVVFAAIAGVPPDLVDKAALSAVDLHDERARDDFYDQILADARMQNVVDPSTNPGSGMGNLRPSCRRQDAVTHLDSIAMPPRRIVQLAKLFGAQGLVQSICQDDFTPASDAIVTLIGEQLMAKPPR
jgi:hypothetical protein